MSSRTLIWILVAVFAAVVILSNARMQFNSAKNNEKEQHIEAAFVTVTAPTLENKSLNEKNLKDSLKDSVSYVSVYGIFNKKAEYSVIFTSHTADFAAGSFADSLISLFSDRNFTYETHDEKAGDTEKLGLSGTFEHSGQKFGVEALYIKREFYSWQIFTVFPFSDKALLTAKNFIASVKTDSEIKIKKNAQTNQK
ncbi:MAG: hypothetical protein LBR69_05660 [Endomicrobium sp.]|jgi:hypothetical protein|nr:hypothetical protein [Endomicrobium sp.]